jgi:uncharacterized protein YxeA
MATRKKKIPQIYITGLIILLILLIDGFFVYKNFIKPNNYLIQNKYYGFKLQTPSGWVAHEKTLYTDDYINQVLADCRSNKLGDTTNHEIGAFRFESRRYPQDLDISKFLNASVPSGIILLVTADCNFGGKNSTKNYSIKTDTGETKYLTFFNNNLKYVVTEYVHISPLDKNKKDKLEKNYTLILNNVISSFKFTR